MMLSSANRREDAARCRELGVAAYLTKPDPAIDPPGRDHDRPRPVR